jgi:hypothetical protein
MSEETDYSKILENNKRGRGRPSGSKNGNFEYKQKQREQDKARKELWRKGILHWKLDSLQKLLYNDYHNSSKQRCVWSISRQIGKSWTVCTIASEEAIRNPGIKMAYIAPEMNDAVDITEQTFDQIYSDAPPELVPKYNTLRNRWEWQNGSTLKIAGTDNKRYKKIRGRRFQRLFLDEFCFYDEFRKVFFECIKPTLTSVPDHKVIFISTPPETPDHESNLILDEAEEQGTIIQKTVFDCPRYTRAYIDDVILKDYKAIGGENSVEFRREYLVERIADVTKLVIPEATKEKLIEITADLERPDYYHIYEAFDWGVMDSTGGLFSYVDFDEQLICIVDEFLLDGITNTTNDIQKVIHSKEESNWGYLKNKSNRYADNNLQIINDMAITYGLPMIATKKDNLHSQVQKVRHLLANNQIIISPKCVNLLSQLGSAKWDKNKTKFTRAHGHHYDLVAALVYLVRNCNIEVNPFPKNYKFSKNRDKWFISPKSKEKENTKFEQFIKDTFIIKNRKKKP